MSPIIIISIIVSKVMIKLAYSFNIENTFSLVLAQRIVCILYMYSMGRFVKDYNVLFTQVMAFIFRAHHVKRHIVCAAEILNILLVMQRLHTFPYRNEYSFYYYYSCDGGFFQFYEYLLKYKSMRVIKKVSLLGSHKFLFQYIFKRF